MSDMLNTAVSGLLTFQRALSTTSHNIANVNTEGYSRQRVDISTQIPSYSGDSYYGNGVNVNAVTRVYDQFLTAELRATTSTFSKYDFLTELAGNIDDVIADSEGGISPAIQEFFSAAQEVADDPTSTTARYNLINVAESLTAQFHNLDTRFQQLQENTSEDIRNTVDEINGLVESIRQINVQLNKIEGAGSSSQQSSDLLDQRDQLMLELSEKIDISTINEGDENLSIYIGNGQTILNGTEAFTLQAVPNTSDPSQDYIIYQGLNQVNDLSDSLKSGGELGALLEFRDTMLLDARNDLGRIAIAIADVFNDQHQMGMDLNGSLGGDFFSFSDPEVIAFNGNPGTATISSSITDISQLTSDDYTLEFDGANWTIISDSGTVSAAVADASPADTTITFEGITLVIDGAASAAAAGDRYRIKPTINGAGSLNVEISDPLLIAAASPVRSATSLDNLGTSAISAAEVFDVTDPQLLNTVTLTFDTANSFVADADVTVNGTTYAAGTSVAFAAGMTVSANGWQAQLEGIPQIGDQLLVEANIGGVGDNSNALALGNLVNQGVLDSGASNFQEAYSNLTGRVGSQTAAAETQLSAAETLMTQARDRRDSQSAVNLDEEAADLIRFQQAYQAASNVIVTVQTLFDSLLSATR